MQPVDLTTLRAVLADLTRFEAGRDPLLPARLEWIHQTNLWTILLGLRTLKARLCLLLCWHPQAARIHLCQPPAKEPDGFQFSQPLQRQLKGLALTELALLDEWERVIDCRFAPRPGDPPRRHLYLEVMGKYSNAVLVDEVGRILASGHGVSERQSRVRPVQPGLPYEAPPALTDPIPTRSEPLFQWQERVALIPGPISQRLFRCYRGLSRHLAEAMCWQAGIPPQTPSNQLSAQDWQALFLIWQDWLTRLEKGQFDPAPTPNGYTVLGWVGPSSATRDPLSSPPQPGLHQLLEDYYQAHLNREQFGRERHRLLQKLSNLLKKLYQRRQQFETMLAGSAQAEHSKQAADLLMAHLHLWQPGMHHIELPDFETGHAIGIPLDPEKNAILNAQAYYRKHRKQKRAQEAVWPLLETVNQEILYLEQVESALLHLETYRDPQDLSTLKEIEEELIQQHYLESPERISPKRTPSEPFNPHRFTSPSGFTIWVGRNNLQNDQLTFRLAQEQDWWFHAQEIPGSHVLLRLPPGAVAEQADLQAAADLAAHFSRGRLSDQVPVVYTRPKQVFKPKGSPPGIVIYRQEQVLWGQPSRAATASPGLDLPLSHLQ
ncbi:NFACT family protein [Synechococcus sp. Nb3U1]|uniref:Rqc2 family fibronectin-binding protein n=1 Tax=Synechococcus sp. Nb3U1 TaxID=1914529 RepID=UPI001F293013|nr:NFACT RNA binding domain-containing protein [Synechococcus sp. Nb3U1]MCF2969600.1 NFACT family protein [Synechococcus sp. Nb3U1]